MAITFAVRGDSFTPRYNGTGGPGFGLAGSSLPTIEANGSAIGGSVLDIANVAGASYQNVNYNGVGNWPSTRAASVNINVSFPNLTGAGYALFYCGGADGQGAVEVFANNVNIGIRMFDELTQSGLNNSLAHGGLSNNTFYDITFTTTGVSGSGNVEVFIDGSSLGTLNFSRSWDNPRADVHRQLSIGFADLTNTTEIEVAEFVVWDEIIDPTSVALTSGLGSLNGASRTAFIDVEQFDGAAATGGPGGINLGGIGV